MCRQFRRPHDQLFYGHLVTFRLSEFAGKHAWSSAILYNIRIDGEIVSRRSTTADRKIDDYKNVNRPYDRPISRRSFNLIGARCVDRRNRLIQLSPCLWREATSPLRYCCVRRSGRARGATISRRCWTRAKSARARPTFGRVWRGTAPKPWAPR